MLIKETIKQNEKKFTKMEKERPDEMEMAKKKDEKRKKEEKNEIVSQFFYYFYTFIFNIKKTFYLLF